MYNVDVVVVPVSLIVHTLIGASEESKHYVDIFFLFVRDRVIKHGRDCCMTFITPLLP